MAADLPETRTGWFVGVESPHMVKAKGVVVARREIGPESVEIPREVEEEDSTEISVERKDEVEKGETLRKRLLELREDCPRQTNREEEGFLL